jgi:hypothetical protein
LYEGSTHPVPDEDAPAIVEAIAPMANEDDKTYKTLIK